MGVTISARQELREEMEYLPMAANEAPPPTRDPASLPVVTYGMGCPVKIYMDGEVVDLIPVRAASAGGDTMIRRNYGYPFIDTANGGSLRGALEALDATMKPAGPNTKPIPGHGTIINRTDLVLYRDTIPAVRAKVQQMIAQGKTQQEVVAAKLTARYDAKVPGGLLAAGAGTRDDWFVAMLYAELKAGK